MPYWTRPFDVDYDYGREVVELPDDYEDSVHSSSGTTDVSSSDSDSRQSQQLVLYTNTRTTRTDAPGSVSFDNSETTTEPSRRRKRNFFSTFRSTKAGTQSSVDPSKSNPRTHRSFTTYVSDKFHPRRTTAGTSASSSPSGHRSFSTYLSDLHTKRTARRAAASNTCQSSDADRASRFPFGRSVLTSAKSHWRDRHCTNSSWTSDKSGSSPAMGTSRSYKPHFPWRRTSSNASANSGQTSSRRPESSTTPETKSGTTNDPRPRVVTSQSTGCPQWLRTAGSTVASTAYSCASMVGTGALWGTGFALTAAQKTAGVVFDSSVVLACHGLGAVASGYSWAKERWAGSAGSEGGETGEAVSGCSGAQGSSGQMIGAFDPIDVGEEFSMDQSRYRE